MINCVSWICCEARIWITCTV